MIRWGGKFRAAFIGDVASICSKRNIYWRAAFNRVNKIMLVMINYLIITWSFQICSVAVRIKGKHTKRSKKAKKETTTTEKKHPLGTVEDWTRTACMPRYLPGQWATEEDTEDCVINIIFKAFFSGFLLINVVSCSLKNKQSVSWT